MSTSVKIPATDLVRALNNGLQGVCKDKNTPILCGVHIAWDEKGVRFTSTDRYIIVRDTVPVVEMDELGELLLPTAEARNLVKLIGKSNIPVLATLELDGDKLTVTVEHGPMMMVAVNIVDDYVKVDRHFTAWKDKPNGSSQVALGPSNLVKLSKLKSDYDNAPLQFQMGERSFHPIRFRMGTSVEGVVMPVRIS
jgi:hypothetical protein